LDITNHIIAAEFKLFRDVVQF